MPLPHGIIEDDAGLRVVAADGGATLAALVDEAWYTEFFGRRMGALELRAELLDLPEAERGAIVDEVVRRAAARGYALVELHLDVRALPLVPRLEEAGFRLVDTRVTFLTLLEKASVEPFATGVGRLRLARPDDRDALQALTRRSFADNPEFHSRFKHRTYFSPDDTARYYAAWIDNHLGDAESLFAVWEVDGEVAGFFIYRRAGARDGAPVLKGVLTAIAPEHRGRKGHLAMQSYLYGLVPEDRFWLDNTTQLYNYPMVKNHVTSRKKLDRMMLTFFWSPA